MSDPQVSIWIKAKDVATSVVKSFEGSLKSVKKAFLDIAAPIAGIGIAVYEFAKQLTDATERGAKFLGVQATFSKIVGDDGKAALAQLRVETKGLISDYDLMVGLNTAVSLGSARSVDDYGKLAKAAHILALAWGGDAATALQQLNDGIARGTRITIEGHRITVNATEANKEYAASHGLLVSQLDATQKKEAFRQAALKEVNRITKEVGATIDDSALSGERFTTSVNNLKDAWSKWLAQSPAISGFLKMMTGAFTMLSGGDAGKDRAEAWAAEIDSIDEVMKKFKELDAEKAKTTAASDQTASLGLDASGFEPQLAYIEKQYAALRGRIDQLNGSGAKPLGDKPEATDTGTGAPKFVATAQTMKLLLDDLDKAWVKLKETSLDAALTPSEETLKALQKAKDEIEGIGKALGVTGDVMSPEFQKKLKQAAAIAPSYRDVAGFRAASVGPLGDLIHPNRAALTIDQQAAQDYATRPGAKIMPQLDFELRRHNKALEDQRDKAKALADAGPLVVASLGAMATAAIQGSKITAQSVIGMITNIAQSLPGVGALAGSIIGVVGGILGGLFGRTQNTPVHIASVSPEAAQTLANAANERPLQVTNIIETGGIEVGRTEYLLKRRQSRDAVPRYV